MFREAQKLRNRYRTAIALSNFSMQKQGVKNRGIISLPVRFLADLEARENEESLRRAQLFEVLAHPTRIMILRNLQSNPMSFAELKRALAIESSGNLQHHLGKLCELVKQTEDGKYAITDDAREALRLLDAMKQAGGEAPIAAMPDGSMKRKLGLLSLVAIIAVLLFSVLYEYSLLVRSAPLFDAFDFSDETLNFMGKRYDYLMLTTANLQNGTRMTFHRAVFTYLDQAYHLNYTIWNVSLEGGRISANVTFEPGRTIVELYKPAINITSIVWSFAFPRYFRVEFEDGQVYIIPILPWPYSPSVVLYGISLEIGTARRTIRIPDSNLISWEETSRAYAFQIGPNTLMLLVGHDQ